VKYIVVISVTLLIIAISIIPMWIFQGIDLSRRISFGEFLYYIASILSMFATFAAVIVALFKDEIMKWFKRPNVDVSLVNENGFEENLDLNQKNPQAKAYICSLKLENIGNVEALQCQLFISEVRIRKNDKKLWNPLKSNKSQNVVKWGKG